MNEQNTKNIVLKTYTSAQLEIDLLSSYHLIIIDFDKISDEKRIPAEIGLCMYDDISSTFDVGFHNFVKEKELSFRDVLGKVDFSGF